MSLTIFDSNTKYINVPVQAILNELSEIWDTTRWKNSQDVSIVYEEGTTDVKELYLSDYITIGKSSSSYLEFRHSNGAKVTWDTVLNSRFVLARSENGLLFIVPAQYVTFGIGKVRNSNNDQTWGLICKKAYSSTDGYSLFTQNAPTTINSYISTVFSSVKNTSVYNTTLDRIYALGSDEYFEDGLVKVSQCTSGLNYGKQKIGDINYYVSQHTAYGMLALKYT